MPSTFSRLTRSLSESVRMATKSLSSHKLRTSLTMLGISIGIFAITFVFTLVGTLEHAITKNLESLGNTVFYVHNWPWRDADDDWFKFINRPKVDERDFEFLKANLKNATGVYLEATKSNITIKAGKRSAEGIGITGLTAEYMNVNTMYEIGEGRFFSNIELVAARPVCVIGVTVAEGLFDQGPYIGRTVTFAGKRFKVIGVYKKQGQSLFGTSGDEEVHISYSMFTQLFNVNSRGVDKIIGVRAVNYGLMDEVEGQTIGLIRTARGLKPAEEDNFSINRQEMILGNIKQISDVLRIGGLIISFFSILVGGFGIANIMFVSVKERTSEIGVQKALGATQPFILSQFLIEAVVLCFFGGMIGIFFVFGLAAVAQYTMNNVFKWDVAVQVSANSVISAVVVSVGIGLIFGFLPARTAARLDPVEAMRQQ